MPHEAESSTISTLPPAGPSEPLTPTALTDDALPRLPIASGGKAITADMGPGDHRRRLARGRAQHRRALSDRKNDCTR